ncbi:hybrid sensor histidine kinase/response regulator transcription factor [Desulfobacter curvatus]|uniref:hybrid sensor histidine kinase/response regulator transcription factor n=1 Tax=Desulfobacter curvatus TaxID=2290 RepID=UPI0012FCBC61|nr:two-component regulator propeller domain-containing protein [Desulfobacter curvatus]
MPPVEFNCISSSNGLPQNSGRVLLQDRKGFIWIGTEDGLVRFDGESILSFRKDYDNLYSLSDNYIGSLEEDDHGRIWAGTLGGGLNVINKKRKTVIRIQQLASCDIRALAYCKNSKRLLIGTGEGLYGIDMDAPQLNQSFDTLRSPLNLRVQRLPVLLSNGEPFKGIITGIAIDEKNIWLSTRNKGIFCFETANNRTLSFSKGQQGLEDTNFQTIFRDRDGDIWIGSENRGLVKVIKKDAAIRFKHFHKSNSYMPANDIMALTDADDGKLWVGTWDGGLALFDKKTGIADYYLSGQNDPFTLPSNIILDIIQAANGQIWLGTFDKGVSWFNPDSVFHAYRKNSLASQGLAGNIVWSFAAQGNKMLWIGTDKGLSRLDLTLNLYNTPDDLCPKNLWAQIRKDDIRALFLDGKHLWIAGRKQGVSRLSLDDNSITPLTQIAAPDQVLTNSYIRLIYKDSHNALWLGASKGLNRFDLTTGTIRRYVTDENRLSLPHYRIRALFEDKSGQMWVGTNSGILLLDPEGNPLTTFEHGKKDDNGLVLAGNGVRGIGEDNCGRLWFATEGGVSIYDPAKKKTVILREKNGLPSDATYCALLNSGYMWVSTLNGLARIDTDTFQIETYTTNDGLPDNEFNFNAWHKLPDNRLALGTLSGFTLFRPEMVPGPEKIKRSPPFYVQPYTYKHAVRYPIELKKQNRIHLNWDNNKISFAFCALNYHRPSLLSYEFKLTGESDTWTKMDNSRFITFNGLSAGDYSFSIRVKDHHGTWHIETKPINFTISQVPWKTIPAYFGYLFLVCAILMSISHLCNQRVRKRSFYLEKLIEDRTAELKTTNEELKTQHLKLDQILKSREKLFTAITHELRTPLAVIISSVETLMDKNNNQNDPLRMIHNRAGKMGEMINNILNLTNTSSRTNISKQPFTIKPALEEAVTPFRQQCLHQKRTLKEFIELNKECLSMNRNTFIMIISNLLSNACKFTEQGGTILINCSCNEKNLILYVEDDGIGITKDEEAHIYDWFERTKAGSKTDGWGIGLAFVKDEIEAAQGSIKLIHNDTPGSKFMATFPLQSIEGNRLIPDEKNLENNREDKNFNMLTSDKNYTILIIEDDIDLCAHLATLFPTHWKKLTATDGESGMSIALKAQPDIVITDLMLPGKSGFEVTRQLKETPQTFHIPIIILTALESEENRLTGLGLSADSFIGKPFSNKELLLRVTGLLSNREKMLNHAKHIILQNPETSKNADKQSSGHLESAFFAKLNKKLGGDQAVALMTLDEAACKMAMSKRSLQREMERAGISWREYKRFRRIRYAMNLLVDKSRQIGEVAELTGYASTAHFSKIFKDVTGQPPSEWRDN